MMMMLMMITLLIILMMMFFYDVGGDNGDAYHATNGNAMNINIYQVALIAYIHTYTPTYLSCGLLFTEDELILHRNE